eukprot:968371-Amphidinium_carterae.1
MDGILLHNDTGCGNDNGTCHSGMHATAAPASNAPSAAAAALEKENRWSYNMQLSPQEVQIIQMYISNLLIYREHCDLPPPCPDVFRSD